MAERRIRLLRNLCFESIVWNGYKGFQWKSSVSKWVETEFEEYVGGIMEEINSYIAEHRDMQTQAYIVVGKAR